VEHNPELWRDSDGGPGPGSRLRTREFWWQHYLIAEYAGERQLPPPPDHRSTVTRQAMFESTSLALLTGTPYILHVQTGDDGSTLGISGPDLHLAEIARLDDAHPMPHTFRWAEVEALARYLEQAGVLPGGPSLALLLLAPFCAVTTDDDIEAVGHRLESELAALDLLGLVEVEVAASVPICLGTGDDGSSAHWRPDPVVGWTIEGERRLGAISIPVAHSLRRPDAEDFPSAAFLELLTVAGAS